MIPTVADCFCYMDQYRMLGNIKDHSLIVARVATLLVQSVQSVGVSLSLDLAVAGALMHDIGKTPCLDTEEDHARKGKEICLSHGLDEIAEIVDQHVVLQGDNGAGLSEKEMVYYADKRVNHDQVVSLDDRLEYILHRYGQTNLQLKNAIIRNFTRCRKLETKIFSLLDFAPHEVEGLIDHSLFVNDHRHHICPRSGQPA